MTTVFFDVDTQLDFVNPSGTLYASGAEGILPAVARLNRAAALQGSLVVSTMDAHAENDSEFKAWPPHCVIGTTGQHKAEATLLERRVVIPNCPGTLPPFQSVQQVILEKQNVDAFQTVTLTKLLDQLQADSYVVYGVVTEVCVKYAALGLLKTGKPVTVVTDAVRALTDTDSRITLELIRAAGGRIVTSTELAIP